MSGYDDFVVFGFNTGRAYQPDGQRISVGINGIGEILFVDHSRGIDGKLKKPMPRDLWESMSQYERVQLVMRDYDKCDYQYDSRANWIRATEFPKSFI